MVDADIDAFARFKERYQHHVEQGVRGSEIYRRLAQDAELPVAFTVEDAASICSMKPESLKMRASRHAPPERIIVGGRALYPRDVFFEWMATLFSGRREAQ